MSSIYIKKKLTILAVVLVISIICFAGCDSSSDKESESTADTTVSAETVTPAEKEGLKSYIIISDDILKDKTLAEIAAEDAAKMEELVNNGVSVRAVINDAGEMIVDTDATKISEMTDLSDGNKKVILANDKEFIGHLKDDGSLMIVMGDTVAAVEQPES